MTENDIANARTLKRLLLESSPLIEEYTGKVCPGCTEVCCKQKHGLYREKDIEYLRALSEVVPLRNAARPLEGGCEMMGPGGCQLPRWLRPFKCTWYFCAPLLQALDEGPPRKARQLSAMLQELADLYQELPEG